jgi:DNA-binding NarL/FixJ family response regulator
VKQTAAASMRVLVADDHPLWRETLRGLLEVSGTATVCAEAGHGEAAVQAAAEHQPDVILMDIDMPRMDGIAATALITKARPEAKVLILSSRSERDEVLAAVRSGASGYLLKTAERDELTDAVRRVHAGEVAFPAELTSMVLAELRGTRPRPAAGVGALTTQERKILDRVAAGRSNAAIAQELHLSPKTVEAHLAAIFTKLDLESTPDNHRRVQAAVTYLTATAASHRDNP